MAGGEEILRELVCLLGNEDDRLGYILVVLSKAIGKEMMRREGTAVECIPKPIYLGSQDYPQAFSQ